MSFELNPHHVRYVTRPPHVDAHTLSNLFSLLETIDRFDRQKILRWALMGFGVSFEPADGATEEQNSDGEYKAFKRALTALAHSATDFFVTHATVTFVLAWLRHIADEDSVMLGVQRLNRVRELIDAGQAIGLDSEADKEGMRQFIEEHSNNARADAELNRERYDLFCDSVVKHLMAD